MRIENGETGKHLKLTRLRNLKKESFRLTLLNHRQSGISLASVCTKANNADYHRSRLDGSSYLCSGNLQV